MPLLLQMTPSEPLGQTEVEVYAVAAAHSAAPALDGRVCPKATGKTLAETFFATGCSNTESPERSVDVSGERERSPALRKSEMQ